MKNSIFVFLLSFLLLACNRDSKDGQTKSITLSVQKEVLLVGTFHYNNPGADVVKTKSFNILNEDSQLELEKISAKIKNYNPTKIFVEWPYNEQNELDSLYQLYNQGQYFKNDSLSDFYLKNEIFQLAFRVAKENNLKTLYGIDYSTSFPFEDVMNDIKKSNQSELKGKIENGISTLTTEFDNKIESGISLSELTYYLNTSEFRDFHNNLHNNLMLLAGEPDDFSGPFLTSEWFKRNLYMWSFVQKITEQSDERVMVLAGAGHIAMFEKFINQNNEWKVKELKEVMKN